MKLRIRHLLKNHFAGERLSNDPFPLPSKAGALVIQFVRSAVAAILDTVLLLVSKKSNNKNSIYCGYCFIKAIFQDLQLCCYVLVSSNHLLKCLHVF